MPYKSPETSDRFDLPGSASKINLGSTARILANWPPSPSDLKKPEVKAFILGKVDDFNMENPDHPFDPRLATVSRSYGEKILTLTSTTSAEFSIGPEGEVTSRIIG